MTNADPLRAFDNADPLRDFGNALKKVPIPATASMGVYIAACADELERLRADLTGMHTLIAKAKGLIGIAEQMACNNARRKPAKNPDMAALRALEQSFAELPTAEKVWASRNLD